MMVETMEPGGTEARTEHACSCPPEQIGPDYRADAECPIHGLAQMLDGVQLDEWVSIERDGIKAMAPTLEEAEAMVEQIKGRRRG